MSQCEIFHSRPEIGVLMAFSKLHIDPLEAAMDPEGVANRVESFRNIQKVQPLSLSESDSQLLKQVNEVRYIIHRLAGETVPLWF